MTQLTSEVKEEIRNFLKVEAKDAAELREKRLQTTIGLILAFGIFVLTAVGAGLYFLIEQIASKVAIAAVEQRLTQSEVIRIQTEALKSVVDARSATDAAEFKAAELDLRALELLERLKTFNSEFQAAQANLNLARAAVDLGQNIRELAKDPDFQKIVAGDLKPAPENMVAAFAGTASIDDLEGQCPEGWSPFKEAQGRAIIGAGMGDAQTSTRQPMTEGGNETVSILVTNLPPHSHRLPTDGLLRGSNMQSLSDTANDDERIDERSALSGETGDGKPLSVMQPWFALYFCIKE